jgi:hypothetical protein
MPYADPKSQSAWCRRQRILLIEKLGGKCVVCQETEPTKLDFDHLENDLRDWATKKCGQKGSILRYKKDFARGVLQLLCKHCHKLKTWRPEEFAWLKANIPT